MSRQFSSAELEKGMAEQDWETSKETPKKARLVEIDSTLIERYNETLQRQQELLKRVWLTTSGVGLVILSFCLWIVNSIHDLDKSSAVVATKLDNISLQITRISDDVRRLVDEGKSERDVREKVGNTVTKLETIVERLERPAPTSTPR